MKKIYLLLMLLAMVFVACKKDRDVEFSTFTVEDEKIVVSYTSIDLSCKVRCAATINEFYLQYDTVADFSTYQEVALTENEKTEVYSVKIGDLLDNTTYYVRYVAVNSYSQVTSEEVSEFKTLQATTPTIEVREITDVLDTIATVGFVLKFDGGADVSKIGVCWSVDSVPTVDDVYVECSSDVINSVSVGDSLVLKISGLEDNTKYYVRAYAENVKGVGYSKSKSFVTLTLPEVETKDVTDIQLTSASLNGLVLFNGNDTTIEYGFCWGEEDELTIENSQNVKVEGAEDSTFTYRLSNLKDETKYYVRAYAKNKIGLVYGNVKEFTSQSSILAVVVTTEVLDVTYASAKVGGKVEADGGSDVTERGVCYSTTKSPTIDNNKVVLGNGLGSFTAELSDLQDGIKYYVRAYAINKKGVSYGEIVEFETLSRFVDLGLSVKWAMCNVGADSPEEYGDYFAWGETKPKEIYNWSTYKYGTDYLTKYCNMSSYGKNGFTDNKTILDSEDDAATANWGGVWRMPTKAEQDELRTNCTWIWTTQNSVNGYKVVGPNGNSIFLPAAGLYYGGSRLHVGSGGRYWSSSLFIDDPYLTDNPYHAYYVFFESGYVDYSKDNRYYGHSVRPVYGKLSQQPETKRYIISVFSSDNSYGTASGGGTYEEGCQVTLTANPKSGYRFKKWNDGNTDNPRVITVTKDAIYTAHFEENQKRYTISVYSNDNLQGTVSGGGTYDDGSQVTLTANPKSGYRFKEWNDGNTDNPRVITITKDAIYTAHFEKDNNLNAGHEYVNLGLSVKWATCNVGATKPEKYGDYFAWGEIQAKENYDWTTYLYCNGSNKTMTKYCNNSSYGNNGFFDNKIILDTIDDAATANWGGTWRMPTHVELTELREQCTWTWTTQNGVNGYRVVGKSGNSIFLPAAGCMSGGSLSGAGSYAYYWSSSLINVDPSRAYYLYFNSDDVDWRDRYRYFGSTVRPVCK